MAGDVAFTHRTGARNVQKPRIQTGFVEQVSARKSLDAVSELKFAKTNGAGRVALDYLFDVENAVLFLMKSDDVAHIFESRLPPNLNDRT